MPRTAVHTREESLEKALHLFRRQGFGATRPASVVGLRTCAQRNVDDRAVREVAGDIARDWERLRQ